MRRRPGASAVATPTSTGQMQKCSQARPAQSQWASGGAPRRGRSQVVLSRPGTASVTARWCRPSARAGGRRWHPLCARKVHRDQCRHESRIARTAGNRRPSDRTRAERCRDALCSWRLAAPMPRFGRDLQRSSRGHHRGRESDGCLCPVGVAMAEVGDDETVTLPYRAKRSSREAFDRSALPMHRAQTCHDVAGCRISGEPAVFVRIPSELPRRTGGSLAFVRSVSVGCD
jgi:hypothetical protein